MKTFSLAIFKREQDLEVETNRGYVEPKISQLESWLKHKINQCSATFDLFVKLKITRECTPDRFQFDLLSGVIFTENK